MVEYKLVFDKEFERLFKKLDNSIQMEGVKKLKHLKSNPKEVGKPLRYFSNIFELHLGVYRIFYLVRDYRVEVLLISIQHKDECDKYLREILPNKIQKIFTDNP